LPPNEVILATRTTTRLLDALKDAHNEPVWAQVDGRYRPVIAGLARRLGLRDEDAEEVAQQALSEFVRCYRDGKYDRSKGRLSSWILGIAHHTTLRLIRNGARATLPGGTVMSEVPDEASLRSIWVDERDRTILNRAMQLLREDSSIDERTIQAFELVAMRGVPAAEVGVQCRMTADQVYVAKSRVTKKLRELVEELTRAFEEDE
jgi:RNA polymerase sigma factor (sigma-70 family)